ncbi:MAG: pantoate--beta-alanine ligase, partial [Proteobacteria bacterium]|nr:pantoate--beta-alanine ligase [Pseudomonadota bacterium]
VVVSIFVNPTQFAPNEDLVAYPRTFAADLRAMRALGVDLIWVPTAAIMYPSGFATRVAPLGAALAGLEDAFRPHFFSGVATVVTKLFAQCRPDVAIFGEKDYQQLLVVTALARDLDLKVGIVAGKTTRERDGLALSSRNAYLDVGERAAAPTLYRTLRWCAAQIGQGRPIGAVLAQGRRAITAAGFRLDYLEARHARTLAPLRRAADGPVRLLVAARIGRTRLVDNIGL